MTRMWERGRLSRRKAVSAAALLIALLCAGWLVWGRPDPAAPSPSASASADIVAASTASPSPSPTPTATPLASDSADPSASPSASPTAAPTNRPKATGTPTPSGPLLPDLYYHHFGVKTMPRCESDIKGYLEVLNAGNVTVPAGQVDVLFTLAEEGLLPVSTTRTVPVALAPGEQYEIDVTFRFADPCPYERLRTWSHLIDPENKIQESNEDNNHDVLTWPHAYVDPTPTPPPTAPPASSTTGSG
jgi:hypothetical protein